MDPKIFIISLFSLSLIATTAAIAGHHYHGYGGMTSGWQMDQLDANQDNQLTFDEYSSRHQEQLRKGFDMIDADKDGIISTDEWNAFREVHGVKSGS